jgi:hypothetical protein
VAYSNLINFFNFLFTLFLSNPKGNNDTNISNNSEVQADSHNGSTGTMPQLQVFQFLSIAAVLFFKVYDLPPSSTMVIICTT